MPTEPEKRFEVVEPNKDLIEILKRIVDQNDKILQQNAKIAEHIVSPKIIFNPKEAE